MATGNAWDEMAHGPPGNTILSLGEYSNKIFCGVHADTGDEIFRYDGTTTLDGDIGGDLGNTDDCYSLLEWGGDLIAGTGGFRYLLKRNSAYNWSSIAQLDATATRLYDLLEYSTDGDLYISTCCNGELWKWDGSSATKVASQLNGETQIWNIVEFDNKIYGGGLITGRLFESSGGAWSSVASKYNDAEVHALCVYNNEIYAGTSNTGANNKGVLLKWNGSNAWTYVTGQIDGGDYIYSLVVYDGDLYGAGSSGSLGKFNGTGWDIVANTYDSQYIRSMLVYKNRIWAGTGGLGGADGCRLLRWNGASAAQIVIFR